MDLHITTPIELHNAHDAINTHT